MAHGVLNKIFLNKVCPTCDDEFTEVCHRNPKNMEDVTSPHSSPCDAFNSIFSQSRSFEYCGENTQKCNFIQIRTTHLSGAGRPGRHFQDMQ